MYKICRFLLLSFDVSIDLQLSSAYTIAELQLNRMNTDNKKIALENNKAKENLSAEEKKIVQLLAQIFVQNILKKSNEKNQATKD